MAIWKVLFISISLSISIFSLRAQEGITDIIMEPVDAMPVFNGDMASFINKRIRYPDAAIRDPIAGTVYVDFVVEDNGKTTGHTIVKGIRQDIDNEALKVSKLIEFAIPATNKSAPVRLSNYLLPIRFKLADTESKKIDFPPVLYHMPEDSCFCIENSRLYDNIYEEAFFGTPEEDITGKHYPLELITQNTKRILIEKIFQSDSFDELFIMRVVISKEGTGRCGIVLKGNDDTISKQTFDLLRKEKYIPAKFKGKPADWHYYFIFRF